MCSCGGKAQRGANVFAFEIGEIVEDRLLGHSGGEVIQHIGHCETEVADTRLAEHAFGVDRDARVVGHLHGLPLCVRV